MFRRVFLSFFFIFLSFLLFSQERDGDTLTGVVVTGTRIPTVKEAITSPITIVEQSTLSEKCETEVLPAISNEVPGLFITARGVSGYGVSTNSGGDISMRGFSSSTGRVLILIDGHPHYSSIYGHSIGDTYISSDIERVEVLRGPASLLYGSNAMGGAVNLITRRSYHEGNHLHARLMGGSFGSQRYSLSDHYKHGKFSIFSAVNYDRTDGHRANSAFQSLSGFIKSRVDLSSQWHIEGDVSIVRFDSENPGTVEAPLFDSEAKVYRGTASVSLDNKHSISSGSVNIYANWGKNDINDGHTAAESPQNYLFHSTDFLGGINAYQTLCLFKGSQITVGADAKFYGGDAYRNPVTEIYADNKRLGEMAGYIFAKQTLNKFALSGGVRLNYHSIYHSEWIPQVGLTYIIDKLSSLKLSYSKGFRSPTMKELYMYVSANEDLLPERANSLDLTINRTFFDGFLRAEMSVFYVEGDNIIEVVVVDGKKQNRNAGAFRNAGVEALVEVQPTTNFKISANYSYLHLEKIITSIPRQKIALAARYNLRKWHFMVDMCDVEHLYLSKNKYENYFLLNGNISFDLMKNMGIFAKGENLLDRDYSTILGFPMPGITVWVGLKINI